MDVSSMSDEELLQIALESEETEMYARENTRATGNPPIDKEALAHIRALILAAHPDLIPELVQGETHAELLASIDPAKEAYQRIAGELEKRRKMNVAAHPARRQSEVVDAERLSPLAKISTGLERR